MVNIELDDNRAEQFKRFCQHEAEINAERENWKQLKNFCKQMQYGAFSLSVKDGQPYKISNPMQEVVLGIVRVDLTPKQ